MKCTKAYLFKDDERNDPHADLLCSHAPITGTEEQNMNNGNVTRPTSMSSSFWLPPIPKTSTVESGVETSTHPKSKTRGTSSGRSMSLTTNAMN